MILLIDTTKEKLGNTSLGRIAKYSFDVANDGANVRSDSWQVAWKENCIEAVISGEEQSDIRYILYFDGKTDSVQLDTPIGEWK